MAWMGELEERTVGGSIFASKDFRNRHFTLHVWLTAWLVHCMFDESIHQRFT
jgi:hypothetical protein